MVNVSFRQCSTNSGSGSVMLLKLLTISDFWPRCTERSSLAKARPPMASSQQGQIPGIVP